MDFGGKGMIMADAAIEFKNELFYGETIITSVAVTEISKISFELIYKLEKEKDRKIVAIAKTAMICYDYTVKKITAIPEIALKKISS